MDADYIFDAGKSAHDCKNMYCRFSKEIQILTMKKTGNQTENVYTQTKNVYFSK